MIDRMAQRLWPLVAVGGLLAGVAVLSILSRPSIRSLPVPPAERKKFAQPHHPTPSGTPTSGKGSSGVAHHADFSVLVLIGEVLCVATALAGVGFLIWYFVKMWLESAQARQAAARAADTPTMARRDAVLAAVDAGIVELARAGGDPRAAIIACWVRLEEVAEAAGTARAPGDTSSDLVARLLGDHQVSSSVLTSLATLYRTARYSTAPIGSSMRDEALSAFEHLRTELTHSRSGPLADVPQQAVDGSQFAPVLTGAGSGDQDTDPRRRSSRRERR